MTSCVGLASDPPDSNNFIGVVLPAIQGLNARHILVIFYQHISLYTLVVRGDGFDSFKDEYSGLWL